MTKKGVTPVIAVILLLLITVAIVGFAFGYLQRALTTGATRAQNQTEEIAAGVGQSFRIELASGTAVVVRNTGSSPVNTAQLNVYVNNGFVACTIWSPTSIVIDATGTCTLASPCPAGGQARVAGPQSEDIVTCR